jgi:hypothetical protein
MLWLKVNRNAQPKHNVRCLPPAALCTTSAVVFLPKGGAFSLREGSVCQGTASSEAALTSKRPKCYNH